MNPMGLCYRFVEEANLTIARFRGCMCPFRTAYFGEGPAKSYDFLGCVGRQVLCIAFQTVGGKADTSLLRTLVLPPWGPCCLQGLC